jgi:hypothetical protein
MQSNSNSSSSSSGGFGQNLSQFGFGQLTTVSNSGAFNPTPTSSTGFTGFGISNTSSGFENPFTAGSKNPQIGGFMTNFDQSPMGPTPTGSGSSDFTVNTGTFSLGMDFFLSSIT